MFDRSEWIRIAVFLFLAVAVAPTAADVDLWGHVLFGRDMVVQGAIPQTDVYSFTSDRPWINHEWLAELTMYGSYRLMGPPGLVGLRLLIIVMIGLLIWASINTEHSEGGRRDMLIMLGIVLTVPRTQHVRPQLFSILLYAVLLLVLTRADKGSR